MKVLISLQSEGTSEVKASKVEKKEKENEKEKEGKEAELKDVVGKEAQGPGPEVYISEGNLNVKLHKRQNGMWVVSEVKTISPGQSVTVEMPNFGQVLLEGGDSEADVVYYNQEHKATMVKEGYEASDARFIEVPPETPPEPPTRTTPPREPERSERRR